MPQKIFKMLFFSLMILSYANLIMSCSHSKKEQRTADLVNTDVRDLIINAEKKVEKAYEDQWDVLAYKELKKSAERVEKTKKNYSEGGSAAKVAEEMREFDADYKETKFLAETRAPKVEGLLIARKRLLDSGIRQMPEENMKLYKLDQQFRDLSDDTKISVNNFSKLQSEYIKLTVQIVQNNNLLKAKQQIGFAVNNKAKRYAPKALNMAELDITDAENMISSNIESPQNYAPSVKKANLSAAMLAAIVDEQKKVNYNLDETAARKIVQQRGQVAQLSTALRNKDEELYYSEAELLAYQNELESSREEISKKNKELMLSEKESQEKDTELAKAEKEKRFQEALASAQKQFSKSEADVYRQDDKILIRLKKMEFPSGKAEVPEKSKQLLDKVASVAKQLVSQQIIVEGHTDSVGSAEVNSKISQKRADSVLSYLEEEGIPNSILQSVGYGFEKPLSSNKTKTGRAQNRRVDIWITPAPATQATE